MSGQSDVGSDPLVGRSLDDRYRIEARIGRGGMGAVYRGRHLMMDRRVAIKVLRPDLAEDQVAIRRFAREAKGTFRFDHSNCVRVFDFGYAPESGVLYLVMEFLDGQTVGDELRINGPMAPRRVVTVARQVCHALAHAHNQGVVHRDLKPDNIMLLSREGNPDFAKVLDFGLAKLFEPDSSGTLIFSLAAITQDGTVFGTPEYMSPEQATGQSLSPVSDVYSLGVVMYEMLTGLLPFQAGSFMAVLSKQVREKPVAPMARRPELGIPPDLDALVMACMAKLPAERPQGALELSERLDVLAGSLETPAPRVPVSVAASETMDLSAQYPSTASTHDYAAAADAAPTLDAPTARTKGPITWPTRGNSRLRIAIAVMVPLVLFGAILVAVAALSGGSGRPATASDGGATAITGADARTSALPAAPGDASPPADAQAARADARAKPAGEPASDAKRRKLRARVAAHIRAAEKAQRARNTLRQIAEADSALRLDPKSRRAAYLLGDALVRSGDKARGCKYLRVARSLSRARARLREAGCK